MATSSRRRMVCVMPVEAIIGKMSPSDQKVNKENAGFKCFVGYQVGRSVFNRYQVRSKPRSKDYSQDEMNRWKLFGDVVKATRERLMNPDQNLTDQIAYSQQTKYKSLYAYVFNQEYAKKKG